MSEQINFTGDVFFVPTWLTILMGIWFSAQTIRNIFALFISAKTAYNIAKNSKYIASEIDKLMRKDF